MFHQKVDVEVKSENGIVFGFYKDGNVLVNDDREAIQAARNALDESVKFLDGWLTKKQSPGLRAACIVSKEPTAAEPFS